MRDLKTLKILKVLAEERTAILAGDFRSLTRIGQTKVRLFDALDWGKLDAAGLDRVTKEASRNQSLLAAAIDGVSTVSNQLKAQFAQRNSLNTYSEHGLKTDVGRTSPAISHRS